MYPPIPSITRSCNTVASLILNIVERLFCTDPLESKPDAGLIIVALKLSPAIVVCGGTTIGSCASSYVPALMKSIAGFTEVGVPIFVDAYLIVLNGRSTEPPKPLASVPLGET